MNDKELADKVVALGVGHCWDSRSEDLYGFLNWGEEMPAEKFVRDPRVAIALMERVIASGEEIEIYHWLKMNEGFVVKVYDSTTENESLPRAIVEACVEALS